MNINIFATPLYKPNDVSHDDPFVSLQERAVKGCMYQILANLEIKRYCFGPLSLLDSSV